MAAKERANRGFQPSSQSNGPRVGDRPPGESKGYQGGTVNTNRPPAVSVNPGKRTKRAG